MKDKDCFVFVQDTAFLSYVSAFALFRYHGTRYNPSYNQIW